LFVANTHVDIEPTVEQVAENVIGAARHVRQVATEPKIALCSGSPLGNRARIETLSIIVCGLLNMAALAGTSAQSNG